MYLEEWGEIGLRMAYKANHALFRRESDALLKTPPLPCALRESQIKNPPTAHLVATRSYGSANAPGTSVRTLLLPWEIKWSYYQVSQPYCYECDSLLPRKRLTKRKGSSNKSNKTDARVF